MDWIAKNATSISIWCGAICTFAIYSILYSENKFYRLFEHIFIGLAAGYSIYITWSQILEPKWWNPMVNGGQWYWAFAGVAGSMFFFTYSKKNVWISKLIFAAFLGLVAGGMFREFYSIYFPQIGHSMKPIVAPNMTIWDTINVIIFYIILFACMSYFFFSFEHKNVLMKKTTSAGRWFLMIGFGAIFGATVMGRMTLFIGRFNFLINSWVPEVHNSMKSALFYIVLIILIAVFITWNIISRRTKSNDQSSEL